jgi:hypothetical protein
MCGKPFEPGNKFGKGRPPGSRNKHTQMADSIKQHGEAIMKQCVLMAMKGNPAAMRLCMNWLAPVWKSSSHNGFRLPPVKTAADVPAALQSLTKAVARGKIAAPDAQAIANMLEKLFRVREVQAQQSSLLPEDTNVDLSRLTEEELEAAEKLRQAAMERGKKS